jgi:acyl carrier protein
MTHASYEEVIRPKVQGTWHIHNALLNAEVKLDYFVALSSMAGILGSRGQSSYAAANTFLDAFMQYRARNGLPSVALDLTAVTGAGYIADNDERETDIFKNFGNETVSEQEMLALLSAAVRGTCSSPQCLTGLKLHLGKGGSWPYFASDARFTELKQETIELAQKEGHNVSKRAVSAVEVFRAAKNDEEMAAAAGQGILQRLSKELAVSLQDLDADRDITSYGLDSLTAIELRNWIVRELRVNLQIMELLSSRSVNGLSALIVRKVKGS